MVLNKLKIKIDECGGYYLEKPEKPNGKIIHDQIEDIIQSETARLSSVIYRLVEEYLVGGDVHQMVETLDNAGLTKDEIESYVGVEEVEHSGYFK